MEDVRGLNVKTNGKGDIFLGFHVDTFIKFLQSVPVNKAGYINIKIVPHNYPAKHGFSHKPFLQEERPQD